MLICLPFFGRSEPEAIQLTGDLGQKRRRSDSLGCEASTTRLSSAVSTPSKFVPPSPVFMSEKRQAELESRVMELQSQLDGRDKMIETLNAQLDESNRLAADFESRLQSSEREAQTLKLQAEMSDGRSTVSSQLRLSFHFCLC